MKRRHFSFGKKSFTLIEMLIVIVIIGILAAALVPRLTDVQSRARNVKRKTDITTLTNAIMIYHSDYGNNPRSLNHLVTGSIMTSLPRDPQMAARHPCFFRTGGWGTDPLSDGFYLTSGFYAIAGIYGTPRNEDYSMAHYGYMYASCSSSTQCKYAFVGALMENDGSINSYGSTVGTGVYNACGWGDNYYERGERGAYGKYNAWLNIINEGRGGLNSKGKLLLNVFDNGSLAF